MERPYKINKKVGPDAFTNKDGETRHVINQTHAKFLKLIFFIFVLSKKKSE